MSLTYEIKVPARFSNVQDILEWLSNHATADINVDLLEGNTLAVVTAEEGTFTLPTEGAE